MSGYNYGHASLFWNEIIYALDTLDEIPEERRVISLISPWIRDLSLAPSNLSSDDWADLFDMPGRLFANLSDVLIALAEIGFSVTVLTLDAEDKALPKQNSSGLVKEETFVRKLTQKQRSNLKVQKKFGIHNKLFCFPYSVLMGSVNMTHRGMLGNSESLIKISIESDQEGYNQQLINAHALLDGSVDYAIGTLVRFEPPPVFKEPMEDNLPNHSLHELSSLSQEPQDDISQTDRLFSVGAEIPRKIDGDERFLNQSEYMSLQWELGAFEKEFRRFLLSYYQYYALHVNDWKETGEDPLSENWHKLIHVAMHDTSLNKKASSTIKKREFVPSDIPGGKVPDWRNLTPDEAITYGTTLGDLRICLVGGATSPILPLKDYNKTNLANMALGKLSERLTGREMEQQDIKQFWSELFAPKPADSAFRDLEWVRNGQSHPNEVSLKRAIKAVQGMDKIRNQLFYAWDRLYPGDTMP